MTLSVRANGAEFSRYYDMNLIKAAATSSASNGTIVTFTLIREDGYGLLATKTGTVTSGKASATFDLAVDCFDVKGVYRARQGKYHIHASVPTPETADSTTFYVMIVPVKIFKQKYLRGVDLLATNILEPQNQPFENLTGVDIVNTSTSQPRGIFTLAWTVASHTLVWDGGPAVTIDMTKAFVHTQLVNAKSNAYIEIDVVTDELPVTDANELVILDLAEIEDDTLRSFLFDATSDVQGRIFVAVEPETYDTERSGDTSYNNEFTDEYADPLTFYRDMFFPADKFLAVRFPHPWIFQHGFDRLEFFFNSTKVASIDKDQWIVNMTKSNTGMVEFVPKVGSTLIFAWFTTAGLAFLTRWASIPSAWHYRLTAGLPDLEKEGRARVREAIARRAAIEALILAGLASAPGLTGESTSKDGVSQSRSYAQGPGGRYAQIVAQHVMFLFGPGGMGGATGGELLKLRQKLLGLYGVTI